MWLESGQAVSRQAVSEGKGRVSEVQQVQKYRQCIPDRNGMGSGWDG